MRLSFLSLMKRTCRYFSLVAPLKPTPAIPYSSNNNKTNSNSHAHNINNDSLDGRATAVVEWLEKALGLRPSRLQQHLQQPSSEGSCEQLAEQKLLQPFPMDSLSKPYPPFLVKRGMKRLQKYREIREWQETEFKIASILMIGRYGKKDCLEMLDLMSRKQIPVSFEQWDAMIQSIVLRDQSSFSLNIMKNNGNDGFNGALSILERGYMVQPSSLKITLALAIGALNQDNLGQFIRLFRKLRQTWWPLSRECYTQLIAAHCDYLIRHRGSDCSGSSLTSISDGKVAKDSWRGNIKSPLLNGIRSLRWVLKHMHLTGMGPDSHQYHLLIIGYCRANLSQKALLYYNWFVREGGIPQTQVLDCLQYCLSRLPFYAKHKTDQLGSEAKPAHLIDYVMSHYAHYNLQPSLDTFYAIVHFFVRTGRRKRAVNYFQQGCTIYGHDMMNICYKSALLTARKDNTERSPTERGFKSIERSRIKVSRQLERDQVWHRIVQSWSTFEYVQSCEKAGLVHIPLDWIVPSDNLAPLGTASPPPPFTPLVDSSSHSST